MRHLHNRLTRAKLRRVAALVRKEGKQVLRDPSSVAIGIVLPVILILLFGYGLSLDVRDVPVAIVMEEPSPRAVELAAGFRLSPYFQVHFTPSMTQAAQLMAARQVDGIVRIRSNFGRRLEVGDAEVQIIVRGDDANQARIVQTYGQAAVAQWTVRRAAEGRNVSAGLVSMQNRLWFNEANESRFFGPGPDRFGDDAHRSDVDFLGDGPRMGARHARGAVRHAGAD